MKKYSTIILVFSFFILGVSLGFFTGKLTSPLPSQAPQTTQTTITDPNEGLYSSQTATLRAIITTRDGNHITVKNLNTLVTGSLPVSGRVVIAKAGRSGGTATSSGGLSSIEYNKEALITAVKTGGGYEVTTIQYLAPTPSLPPITTSP